MLSMTNQWRSRLEAVGRELRGVAIALLLVALMSIIAYFVTHYLGQRRGSYLYLLPVLLAGWRLGLVPALAAAVGGVLWSGYFFYSSSFYPLSYAYFLSRPRELLHLSLFMVVAVVTSHLATAMKRQTELARKRENEMSSLYAFSRRLAAAPSAADIHRAIEDHLAILVQRKVVLFGAGSGGAADAKPDDATLPERVLAAIADVRRSSIPATTITDSTGNVWLVRWVSEKTPDFGVIAIDLGNVSADALADVRQRVEDVLSDATATLERLDLARALNEARMRSETELLREALIGSVSHELRTPLASILGAATVLSKAPALQQNERLAALANVVRDEAERLNNEIQNLLNATRISRQQVKPRFEWVEPADVVNSALMRRRRHFEGHAFELDMDSNLPLIYVDAVLLEQALVQVIDNAAKYSPPGSTVKVSARRNGQDLVLSVRDEGAGLTVEENAQLGERFFRGARVAATTPGSGLGLWIAKAFVVANGGRVQAMSEGVDRGTTVAIQLPLASHSSQPEAASDG